MCLQQWRLSCTSAGRVQSVQNVPKAQMLAEADSVVVDTVVVDTIVGDTVVADSVITAE